MSLLLLQQDMRDHLLGGSPAIAFRLQGDEACGLAVYHHAYRAQLIDCLSDTYEKVWAWLGDEAFEAAASHHVEANAPCSWTLGHYGETFVQTLADLYPADPEVAELAWLDWTLRRAFDGLDARPVDPGALDDVDWDAAVFKFVPTLKLGVLSTNAAAIWSALAEEECPRPPNRWVQGPACACGAEICRLNSAPSASTNCALWKGPRPAPRSGNL